MQQPFFETEYKPGEKPEILSKQLRSYDDLVNVEHPLVTVLSLSLNLGEFLEDTIRSVANQSFRNFEHLVIDGGSTDNTLEILKKYPHVKWVSEKDNGPMDAGRKGFRKARGKYLTMCYVSDGYANQKWLEYCVNFLENNKDFSLVAGQPQYLTEDGIAGPVSLSNFNSKVPPSGERLFSHALKTYGSFAEGNLFAYKEIIERCYPKENYCEMADWNKFAINFYESGYLAHILPVVANFGRTHGNQLGQKFKQQHRVWQMAKNFHRAYDHYRWDIILGRRRVVFVNKDTKQLPIEFSRKKFVYEYICYKVSWQNISGKLSFYFYILKRIPNKLKQVLAGGI